MSELEEALSAKCNDKSKREKFRKLYDQFLEDVEDTFNEIASITYGPFLPTIFALTAQMGVGAALDYASFVGKLVTRNTVGAFVSTVGLAVGTINGAETLLKYAAAKNLHENLIRRRQMSLVLLDEVNNLLNLLVAFKNVDIHTDQALLGEIHRALANVKKAALIVGREKSKIRTTDLIEVTENPVNPARLQMAINHIEEAIISLGGQQLAASSYNEKLEALNRKHSIDIIPSNDFTDSVGIVNPLNIVTYFRNAVDTINERNLEDGKLSARGQRELQYYIIDFISTPGISEFFKTFAASKLLGDHITTLGQRLPIRSSLTASFAKEGAKKAFGEVIESIDDTRDNISSGVDDIFSYLRIHPYGTNLEFPDDDTTLLFSTGEVLAAQSSILLMGERFKTLQTHSGALKSFLTPALNNLDDVQRSMEDVILRGEEYNTPAKISSISSQKIEWMGKLSLAKTLIAGGVETPAYIGKNKIPISPHEVNKRFADSELLYGDLRNWIHHRIIDEKGNPIPSKGEQIVDIANRTLSSFAFGPLALFNPKARDSAIGGLQSIRLLLRRLMSADLEEIRYVERYIDSVERNPLFASTIKPAWDEMLNRLSETHMGQDLSKALSRGNLNTLLNAIEAGSFTKNAVKDFFECGEEPIGPEDRSRVESMASIIGVDGDEAIKQVREADQSISRLINKGKLLKILEDS